MVKLLPLIILATLMVLTGCQAKNTDIILPLATPIPSSAKLIPEIVTASASVEYSSSKMIISSIQWA